VASSIIPNRDRLEAGFRADPYTLGLGMELIGWGGGSATVRWTPRAEHRNFSGTLHGGAVFSLADAALAVASNSWGRISLALSVDAQFLAAPAVDVPLVATATERSRRRRVAAYLIDVTAEPSDRSLVASFHAIVHRTGRWHLGEEAWPGDWRDAH
jgi:acyl-CoA thioesterase